GIRDRTVTGVQTCALPISSLRVRLARAAAPYLLILPGGAWLFLFFLLPILTLAITSLETGDFITGFEFTGSFDNYGFGLQLFARSEERRVGKECSCSGGAS